MPWSLVSTRVLSPGRGRDLRDQDSRGPLRSTSELVQPRKQPFVCGWFSPALSLYIWQGVTHCEVVGSEKIKSLGRLWQRWENVASILYWPNDIKSEIGIGGNTHTCIACILVIWHLGNFTQTPGKRLHDSDLAAPNVGIVACLRKKTNITADWGGH